MRKMQCSQEKTERRKLKNDVIFVFALLFAVMLIGACYFFLRGKGDTVVVTVERVIYGEYSLQDERTVEIHIGDARNILVIRDGKAYMESASCPDGRCTDHRPIFRDGESIICLPNKVVITVFAKNEPQPDIVA